MSTLRTLPTWFRFVIIPIQAWRLYRCDRDTNPYTAREALSLAWIAFRTGFPFLEVDDYQC